MHEPNANAFTFNRIFMTVRADYYEFAVHSCAHRKFRKILHCRRLLNTKTRVLQGQSLMRRASNETSCSSSKSYAGSSNGSGERASLAGIIVGSTLSFYGGCAEVPMPQKVKRKIDYWRVVIV